MIYEIKNGKARVASTYKQLTFLESFKNVTFTSSISASQVFKRVSKSDMSSLIDAAQNGETVIIEC
jgi:uroporphyrinogen-III synthase